MTINNVLCTGHIKLSARNLIVSIMGYAGHWDRSELDWRAETVTVGCPWTISGLYAPVPLFACKRCKVHGYLHLIVQSFDAHLWIPVKTSGCAMLLCSVHECCRT